MECALRAHASESEEAHRLCVRNVGGRARSETALRSHLDESSGYGWNSPLRSRLVRSRLEYVHRATGARVALLQRVVAQPAHQPLRIQPHPTHG